ncbi:MAG TPA: gamma-glutamylcyclotransferase [Burkholderiaceae bacterium]|nr:gamma-glutamylcyclotransferase [Burkholderiaceae bacterium]
MGITRDDLENDRVRAALAGTPGGTVLLTEEAFEASLATTLASAPDGDVWLFGYGSLIWNPMIRYAERRPAVIYGFHRGFYLYSRVNRGTYEYPGLVLGLDRGGCCRGIAFRIAREDLAEEFRVLWRREMLTGAYLPRWAPVQSEGQRFSALTFIMNRTHEGYAGRLPDTVIVDRLRNASGAFGPAYEYLYRTLLGLRQHGIDDPYLARLWEPFEHDPRYQAEFAGAA